MHLTSPYRAPWPSPLDMGPHCTETPNMGRYCTGIIPTPSPSVHLRDLPTSAYIWWLLKDIRGSYWDAFLLGKETQLSIICIRHYTRISIQSHSDNTTITVTLASKVKTFNPKCLQKRQIFNSRRYSGINTYQQ